MSARGIVQDYKSGKGSFSARADRRGAAAPGAALHARAARPRRDRAARRRLPRALGRPRLARDAPRRVARRPPGLQAGRLPRRGASSGARSRQPASTALDAARRIRTGDVAHDPEGRRVPDAGATSGRCAGWRGHERREQTARPSRPAARCSSRPGPAREDLGARRALRPRGVRRRPRRRVGARHHLHPQGRRRASRHASAPRCSSAGGPTSPASSTARGSRPSTASAAGCFVRIRSRSGSTRASTSSTRSTAPFSAARRSTARSRRSAPRADSERLTLLATYGSKRLRKMLTGVYETLRSAGRRADARAGRRRPTSTAASSDLRGAAQGLLEDTGATENHVAAAQAALDLPVASRHADRPRGAPDTGRAGRELRGGAQDGRAGRARAGRDPRQGAPPGAARPLRSRVPGRQGARVGARLRGSPAARPRPARRRRARPRGRAAALPLRSWSTSSRTRTRSSAR